jgi:hypothetical protein
MYTKYSVKFPSFLLSSADEAVPTAQSLNASISFPKTSVISGRAEPAPIAEKKPMV